LKIRTQSKDGVPSFGIGVEVGSSCKLSKFPVCHKNDELWLTLNGQSIYISFQLFFGQFFFHMIHIDVFYLSSIYFFIQQMEHILVQVFKNLQFWKVPKTKKLKPPMVTIFHLNHPNLFFKKSIHPVSESKFFFPKFCMSFSTFVWTSPFIGLGLFWSNVS